MKKLNYLLFIVIIGGFTVLVGCGDDNGVEIGPADALKERISKTWVIDGTQTVNQVITPAGDRTNEFENFSLTINKDNSYSTTGNPERSPWPASGTWSFTNEDNITATTNSFSITRDDGLKISANLSANDEQLELSFNFEESTHDGSNMRTMAVEGEWTFILVAAK